MRKPRPCVEKKLFDSKNSYHKVCRAVEVAFVKNSRLFRAICAVALLRNLKKTKNHSNKCKEEHYSKRRNSSKPERLNDKSHVLGRFS